MTDTETVSKNKSAKPEEKSVAKTHYSVSEKISEAAMSADSNQLSKNLANSLMGLISEVNKDGVTPETVNASCNAASQIYKILRLNYEMRKEGF